jgi:hypothetical protein
MRQRIYLVASLLILAISTGISPAQEQASSWVGEWGEHQVNAKTGEESYKELSIPGCFDAHCTINKILNRSVMNKDERNRRECETGTDKVDLQIQSTDKAVAHLRSEGSDREQCSLILTRTVSDPASVTITQGTGDCSDFCSANSSFAGTYPLLSRSRFYGVLADVPAFGDDYDFCYAAVTPASKELCGSIDLSDEEHQWAERFDKVRTLFPAMNRQSELQKLVSSCDAAAEPSTCLTNAFNRSTEKLNTTQANWQKAETKPGDPAEAKQKIASIVGSYTHRFRNGDTSGDKYWSTDTLDIEKASEDSIRFSVDLSFYNGHECSMDGEASYTRRGIFVEEVQRDEGEMCYFELIPTATGIKLGDPTWKCRDTTCGNRGSYDHAFFSFKRRTPLKAKIKLNEEDSQ